jgi:hypothetical protein
VTVSNNPSVDELSAALGLTLLLNKMDKHATAVFSGHIPPAITFLDPEKTFEDTTDSLRDFIIALDKEKADHLRYKLEGDLVKIYITPYRTTITSDDLEFSQGDYNVELVIALGVENKENLDAALEGHGKILHDATVVTLTAGEQVSNLGSIDWHDSNASSLSEMLSSLHETMKLDKKMMDKSIATAWLTGIVAATERFSNPRTTSRVMTLAASLMAAGADQQLIAARLEEAAEVEEATVDTPEEMPAQDDDDTKLAEDTPAKIAKNATPAAAPAPRPDGELVISHEKQGTLDEVSKEVGAERLEESARAAQRALEKHEEMSAIAEVEEESSAPIVTPEELPQVKPTGAMAYTPPPAQVEAAVAPDVLSEPSIGGTLNATSEQAAEDKRREIANDKNKVILSHKYIGDSQPTYDAPINSVASDVSAQPLADVLSRSTSDVSTPIEPASLPTAEALTLTPPSEVSATTPVSFEVPSPFTVPAPAPLTAPVLDATPAPAAPTLADIDAQHRAPGDEARAAIEAAFAASPESVSTPAVADVPIVAPLPSPEMPADMGLPLPPPLPPTDFSGGMPPLPPLPTAQPEILGEIFAPEPQAAPMPVVSQPADPGQFRIPGQ